MRNDMTMRLLGACLMAGALFLSGPVAPAMAQHAHGGTHDQGGGSDDLQPSTREFIAVNEWMHEAMAIEFTGDADVDFMRGMIPHHQAAVEMALVVLEHGSDPEVRALATEIIAAQNDEIEMMQRWLENR